MLAIINWIIGSGEGSRLYKKIVEDEQRATHLESHVIDLQDYSLLAIRFYPKNQNDIPTIFETIKKEINLIVEKGLTPDELERAIKQTSMEYFELFEDNDELAHELARLYLATGDPSYVFTYRENEQITTDAIQHYLKKYCNPILMHTGTVSPMHAEDDDYWHQLQEESDELDYRALAHRTRESHLEAGSFVHSITPGYATQTNIKDPSSFTTEQGLKVLYAHRNQTPTVCVLLSLKSDYYYDPQHQQGLNNFVMQLLLTPELSCAFEQCGASIEVQPGGIVINALAQDLQYVLTLLKKMLVHVHFDERHIEKIHAQLRADIHEYWDDAYACIDQLAKEAVYKNHPYAHNALGTVQSIAAITRDDLYAFYQKYITPHGATLAIVGDIATQNVADLLAATGFHEWSGGTIPAIQYPHLAPVQPSIINHPMNRDQVALCFAGISVARTHPDYDALALFDHYMCGGGGGAMSSLLFQIREQTGLFYTIKGSLLAYADKQPGMIMIKTLVSPENLAQTSDQLLDVINNGIRSFSKDHLDIAQQAFIYSLSESLASNYQCAQTYAHLHRFGWSADYFNRRAEQIRAITLDQIQTVVPRYLNSSILTCVTVGRLDQ
jgi:zinc protease